MHKQESTSRPERDDEKGNCVQYRNRRRKQAPQLISIPTAACSLSLLHSFYLRKKWTFFQLSSELLFEMKFTDAGSGNVKNCYSI